MNEIELLFNKQRWRADLTQPCDLSIPLQFDGPQPNAFGAPHAHSEPYCTEAFTGDVRHNGSCNCSHHVLTPHCNGTHTECVGHLTYERVNIRDIAVTNLMTAQLITVQPTTSPHTREASDVVITLSAVQAACSAATFNSAHALIIRSLPNELAKRSRQYDSGPCPAYFEPQAMQWIVAQGFEHLLVDLPSVDRIADGGALLSHRIFWGMPNDATSITQATRPHTTLTELIYVPTHIMDGLYLLNLQVAPFVADAAPSRPILYPLMPV